MENRDSNNPVFFPLRHPRQWLNLKYARSSSFVKLKHNPCLSQESLSQEGQRLPSELIIHILSLLGDDRQTLTRCCLVSSAWLDFCRAQFYCNFTMKISKVKDFVATLNDFDRFEHVGKHIKHVVIHGHDHWENPHRKPMICSHLFRELLTRLPNLRSLTIENVRFVHSASHPTWRNVKSLFHSTSLFASDIQTSSDACAFKEPGKDSSLDKQTPTSHPPKRALPIQLEHLAISGIGADEDYVSSFKEVLSLFSGYKSFTCNPTRRPSVKFPQEFPSRTELNDEQELLWNFYHRFEFSTLRFNSTPASYETIVFLWIGCASFEQFQDAVLVAKEVNSSLECFGIDPSSMYEDTRMKAEPIKWSQLNLLNLSSLTKLILSIRYATLVAYQPDSVLDGRAHLLCCYPAELLPTVPRTVQEITIMVYIGDDEVEAFMKFVDWDTLQNELLRFPDLKLIKFLQFTSIRPESQEPESASSSSLEIEQKLPLLHDILEVVDGNESDEESDDEQD
ncbi:hypothetical protein C8Q75DRAFT_766174 [Abortiporus biennis]|nr:hypothetical protein C8Q75DRAFT_766174 [Abortiporus biennis]